jgi:hypothetical protein
MVVTTFADAALTPVVRDGGGASREDDAGDHSFESARLPNVRVGRFRCSHERSPLLAEPGRRRAIRAARSRVHTGQFGGGAGTPHIGPLVIGFLRTSVGAWSGFARRIPTRDHPERDRSEFLCPPAHGSALAVAIR